MQLGILICITLWTVSYSPPVSSPREITAVLTGFNGADRGMSLRQTKDHVWKNKLEYAAFGATAFILSVIPLANMVFAVCNTVGAALWAVEIEKQRGNPCFLESHGAASSSGSDAVAALDIAVDRFGAEAQREFGKVTVSAATAAASTSPGAGVPDETSGPSRSTSTSWLLGTMKAAVR